MTNILYVTQRIFLAIFSNLGDSSASPIRRLILQFTYHPLLQIGAVCLIIGFSVGILKRIIHS